MKSVMHRPPDSPIMTLCVIRECYLGVTERHRMKCYYMELQ